MNPPFAKKYHFALLFFGVVLTSAVYAKPLIVIDPGHEPTQGGTIGTCQQHEVVYNDEMAQFVTKALEPTYKVILTRQPEKPVQTDDLSLKNNILPADQILWESKKSLLARPAIANKDHAQLFIAIHHDSAPAEDQIFDPALCHSKGGKTLSPAFTKKFNIGFNIFVDNQENDPRSQESILLAENIGKQMIALGRTPSNYHVYPGGDCKSCRPIDAKLGVWYENLAVLRNAKMPAVLIEVGNIVDTTDEAKINNDAFRSQFSVAVKTAVDQWFNKSSLSQ